MEVNPEVLLTNPDYPQAEDGVRASCCWRYCRTRGGTDARIQWFADKRWGAAQFALLVIKEHRKLYHDSHNATVLQGLASASYHTAGTGLKEQNGSVLWTTRSRMRYCAWPFTLLHCIRMIDHIMWEAFLFIWLQKMSKTFKWIEHTLNIDQY